MKMQHKIVKYKFVGTEKDLKDYVITGIPINEYGIDKLLEMAQKDNIFAKAVVNLMIKKGVKE